MKRRKESFDTKENIVKILSSEFEHNKLQNTLIVIVEYKRLSKNDFLTKAEFIQNGKAKICGAATQAIEGLSSEQIDFERIKVGESKFQGYLLKYDEPKLGEFLKEGFKNWFVQGRIPFIH